MFSEALVMSSLSGFSLIMLYKKMPKFVQKFALKHVLITDAVLMCATVSVFGTTAVGLLSGGMLDVIMTCAIHVANHPAEYEYLFDAKAALEDSFSKLNAMLVEYGKSYRAAKHPEVVTGD
jgi:hypothetical protein